MEYTEEDKAKIIERLYQVHKLIHEEDVEKMAKLSPAVSNVLTGLCPQCIGIWSDSLQLSGKYQLVYINAENNLNAQCISLDLADQDKFEVTMAFCTHLSEEFENVDVIDLFNTYSNQLRSYIESNGGYSIGSNELREFRNDNITIMTKREPILVPVIDKVDYYRNIFGSKYNRIKEPNTSVVYLLYDITSRFFKIGRSINIGHRERTLQSQMPEVETIAFWEAPAELEKQLHRHFRKRHKRGEWFKLSIADLNELCEIMKSYH